MFCVQLSQGLSRKGSLKTQGSFRKKSKEAVFKVRSPVRVLSLPSFNSCSAYLEKGCSADFHCVHLQGSEGEMESLGMIKEMIRSVPSLQMALKSCCCRVGLWTRSRSHCSRSDRDADPRNFPLAARTICLSRFSRNPRIKDRCATVRRNKN